MANKTVECPHCSETFEFSLDNLSQDEIKQLATKIEAEGHRHKSADEFADCPECRQWFDNTAEKYTIALKEPTKEPPKEPPPTRPQIGSIFQTKTGGESHDN